MQELFSAEIRSRSRDDLIKMQKTTSFLPSSILHLSDPIQALEIFSQTSQTSRNFKKCLNFPRQVHPNETGKEKFLARGMSRKKIPLPDEA